MQKAVKNLARAMLGVCAIAFLAAQGPQDSRACPASTDTKSSVCDFELLVWDLVRGSSDNVEIEAYLHIYPDGRFVDEARQRLGQAVRSDRIKRVAKAPD